MIVRSRRCSECREQFVSPESFRQHKRGIGGCRSVETLTTLGFTKTAKGWRNPIIDPEAYATRSKNRR